MLAATSTSSIETMVEHNRSRIVSVQGGAGRTGSLYIQVTTGLDVSESMALAAAHDRIGDGVVVEVEHGLHGMYGGAYVCGHTYTVRGYASGAASNVRTRRLEVRC
jgi:hypothetical protein